jgi:Protein of unknown function (DUF3108)
MPWVEGSDHLHWRRRDGAASVLLALMIGSLSAAWGQQSRAAASEPIEPFQAGYNWSWKGTTVAYSRLEFTHQQDDLWVYSSSSEPRGIGHLYPMRPKLESTMRLTANYVQPLHLKVTGGGTRRDADVQFDWSKGRATGMYEGAPIDLAVTPGVQDDLSVQIAMIRQLALGQTPEILREIDKDGIRDYLFKQVGAETLDTAIGRIDTIVYSTQHPGSPRVTRYWCAPSQGFVPLKVQQTKRTTQGDGYDVEWTMDIDSLKRG